MYEVVKMNKEQLTENLVKLTVLTEKKDTLTEEELNELGQIKSSLTKKDREQMVNILAEHCFPWILEKDRFSAAAIKSLNRDQQYFTRSELFEMIKDELSGTFGTPDFKAVYVMIKSLICHKYYKTIEEAESHYPENQKDKINQ